MSTEQPRVLGGAASWTGDTLARESDWVRHLGPAEIEDLDRALSAAKRSGARWDQLSKERFPLRALSRELEALADALENGKGLVKLRGLPARRYSHEELKLIFYGIGVHLGTPVYQSARGELLGEICNEGADVGDRRGKLVDARGNTFLSSRARAQSTQPLRWHTDRTDVVGLLCVSGAARGGTSRIASAVAIHDEMVRRRPDLAAELYQDLIRSRLGEEAGGAQSTYALPVFGVRDGKLSTHYSRTYVEAAQKLPHVPRLSAARWEALDLLAALGDELCYEMHLGPGDMQFLNNHVIYHARSHFEDDPATGRVRLLYRLWLSMPNSRALPAGYEVLWGTTRPGALRGGIARAAVDAA